MNAAVAPARVAALRRRLLAWWDAGHRDLPWRFPQGAADPYRVWLAEVMLQQTQVAAVVPYYRRFVARFPTLEALAAAAEEDVLALWSGLGYYARGRRLRAAAREALARHGGLPRTPEALRALPGFGPYTAGAVASIAFAAPAAAVDGNVARVLARLFLVDGAPEAPATRARLWALAAALVDPARPGDWNQALMELGATVCGKPAPRCARCPLGPLCGARRAGRERELPPARARRAPRALAVACAVLRRGPALLLVRRPAGGLFGGLWELPGVEVAPGEDGRASLARRAASACGRRVSVREAVASVERALTHRLLTLTAYRCEPSGAAGPTQVGAPAEEIRWATPAELEALPVSTAVRRLLAALPGPATRARGGEGGERAERRPPLAAARRSCTGGAASSSRAGRRSPARGAPARDARRQQGKVSR